MLIHVFLCINPVNALENISFKVEKIETKNWQLHSLSIALSGLQNTSQQLTLLINKIALPAPFSGINFADIQCDKFTWQDKKIDCEKGTAKLKAKTFYSGTFDFSFSLSEQKSSFSIKGIKLAKGRISLTAKEQGENWSVSINTRNLSIKDLHTYFAKEMELIEQVTSGSVTAEIKASGNRQGFKTVLINAMFKQLSLQANQGEIITESVDLEWNLQAKLNNAEWQWHNRNKIKQGELYIEPVYLKIEQKTPTLMAKGVWSEQGNITLQEIELIHPEVIRLQTLGQIKYKSHFSVDNTHISTEIINLESFAKQYILPFIEQTEFEGIKLKGHLNAEIDIQQSTVTQVSVGVKLLSMLDDKKRFSSKNLTGTVNWSNDIAFNKASEIFWEQLTVKAIPIDASQLKFLFKQKQLTLLEHSSLPLLGGSLDITQFNWQGATEGESKVYFEGNIHQLSLEKLTYALDWTPLSGNISGYIPGVTYQDKTLTIDGELQVKLFGGIIKINKLSSSGMLTDFSRFSMDMEINNLDLLQITQKFKMGGMEGRVSGFISDLYLENWQPVTFYAWLGTPENDHSTHRISQKAVENIASIGGGGAADIISKGFLGFFDSFNYDRLGFGCYLHQGVCQLMGVEAAEQGYYLVKGSGIPRIDIMGYNTQVDWSVLMQRLSRISSTEDVVIE
ncbi:MAG: C4-dicarboxylate ABC transporter [Methylomarinum sp.]|nr:C4-dicarboxylate ABC transporter [Methylomarinum sp.]